MPKQFAHGIRKRGKMSENIKCATTNRDNKVFLLVESDGMWAIKSADTNEKGARWIFCAGDRPYVQERWNNFVAGEKNAIAPNFHGLAAFNQPANFQRP
jgi:hypothetical protein